jgi:hypothetical protein
MKNKIIYTIFLFTAVSVGLISCRKEKIQPEQANGFIKYYGKGGTQTAGNVALTPDGGYILVGTSDSYGNGKDMLVVKTDKYGNEEWSKVLGGAGDDEGKWVIVTPDNGYVISGSKAENASPLNTDVWIVKLNSEGQEVWSKVYGVTGKNETAARVINTKYGGGYISVGTTSAFTTAASAVYVIKMNEQGDSLWSAKYGNNTVYNIGTAIQQITVSSYLTSAYTTDAAATVSSLDMLVTKGRLQDNPYFYNANSNIGKDKANAKVVNAKDILLGDTGDKYVLGNTVDGDMYIANISDAEMNIYYAQFGTAQQDNASSFEKTSDGGFIVTGSTMLNGNWDVFVVRTNSNGSVIWKKTFGGSGNDYGIAAAQTANGGYVVSATIALGGNGIGANNVMSLIRIDSNGELK